jgi:uncharacterized coiled-coil protein SlyX
MSKYAKATWVAITLIVMIWVWPFDWPHLPKFNWTKSEPPFETIVVTNQKIVDSLKTVIIEHEYKQKMYDSTITNLNTKVTNLKIQIEQDNKSLTELKKKNNEKTNNVGKFTTGDISNFLSNRYRDSIGR